MQQDNSWSTPASSVMHLLGRNLPIVTFLMLAAASMLFVYWFFSPPTDSTAQAISISSSVALSAPIYKELPDKPVAQRLAQSPGPIRIGIVAGHLGSDSGAVCADGLTEAEINLDLAQQISAALTSQGIPNDILEEFDPRLGQYAATAVVSIHADSCTYINDLTTGFKIAGSALTNSDALEACVERSYQEATQLPYNANTITEDMTDNHLFRELPLGVPAIIIEVGFMNLDREILTTNSSIPASGIINGIDCYLNQVR